MPRLEHETLDEYIERISNNAAAEQVASAQLQADYKTTERNIHEYNRRLEAFKRRQDRNLENTVATLAAFAEAVKDEKQ